ncbi:MAG: type II toxin-antitoxin system VapC family toxin [Pseudomonadota bacterium]
MRVLLDTNALIYTYVWPERLSKAWRTVLVDTALQPMTSVACLWEIAIKSVKHPDRFKVSAKDLLTQAEADGMSILPIVSDRIFEASELPLHHGDPFDRLIIAEARAHNAAVMTTDRIFSRYDVELVVA